MSGAVSQWYVTRSYFGRTWTERTVLLPDERYCELVHSGVWTQKEDLFIHTADARADARTGQAHKAKPRRRSLHEIEPRFLITV